MSQSEHHHHHHTHGLDSASRWKHRTLRRNERRKKIKKWLLCIMYVVAFILACVVVFLYTVN